MGESWQHGMGWARSLPLTADIKTGRDWAREHLRSLEWTAEAPETVDAVLLTVSELLTNAQRHAHSSAQLMLTWDHRCLHVTVHDASAELPTPRPPSAENPGGRGLLLVDALADSWAAHPCPYGKAVTACFRPPARIRRTIRDAAR